MARSYYSKLPDGRVDEQLFEICAKLGVPLVDVFGRSKNCKASVVRQLHCYCATKRKLVSVHKVGESLGKNDDYGYRAVASVEERIRKNTLTPSMKDVLEFYELI